MSRDELIEKAARAISAKSWDGFKDGETFAVAYARIALAVFREHTAPAGDDRDELARVIAASRGYGFGWGQIRPLTDGAYRAVADAILARFRLVRRGAPAVHPPCGRCEACPSHNPEAWKEKS